MFRKSHDLGLGWTATMIVSEGEQEMFIQNAAKGESIRLNKASIDRLRAIFVHADKKAA